MLTFCQQHNQPKSLLCLIDVQRPEYVCQKCAVYSGLTGKAEFLEHHAVASKAIEIKNQIKKVTNQIRNYLRPQDKETGLSSVLNQLQQQTHQGISRKVQEEFAVVLDKVRARKCELLSQLLQNSQNRLDSIQSKLNSHANQDVELQESLAHLNELTNEEILGFQQKQLCVQKTKIMLERMESVIEEEKGNGLGEFELKHSISLDLIMPKESEEENLLNFSDFTENQLVTKYDPQLTAFSFSQDKPLHSEVEFQKSIDLEMLSSLNDCLKSDRAKTQESDAFSERLAMTSNTLKQSQMRQLPGKCPKNLLKISNEAELKQLGMIKPNIRQVQIKNMGLNNQKALKALKMISEQSFVSSVDLSGNKLTHQLLLNIRKDRLAFRYLKNLKLDGSQVVLDKKSKEVLDKLTREGLTISV